METDLKNFKYFMIVDLEASCCDKNTIKRHEMETIEIGAVMVSADTLQVVDEYQTFIKPVRNPNLTKFCTELTSITQADVAQAPGYSEAVNDFKNWFVQYQSFVFCSWGDYDKGQFQQDSDYHGVAFPIGAPHVNIKKRFTEAQGLKKRYGMAGALKCAGLELDGTHHRGIDDARNMAKLMPFILGFEKVKINSTKSKKHGP